MDSSGDAYDEAAFTAAMAQPATRADLLEIAGTIQFALFSEALLIKLLVTNDDKLVQLQTVEETLDRIAEVNATMQAMVNRWTTG